MAEYATKSGSATSSGTPMDGPTMGGQSVGGPTAGSMSVRARLALVASGGAALGLLAWSWMQFGDSIYLTRLSAIVAGCF